MDPALAVEEAHRAAEQKLLLEALARGDSTVARFYDDATVFVTGGSGFLGKSLVEKLFRACKIKKIYYLLREKRGKTPETRLKEILSDPVYDLLHREQPNFVSKIIPIQGDTRELNLGLSDDNWNILTEEVNVIFHVAATINFNEEMQIATEINVRGTQEMLRLARGCHFLKSMVHVSTAFAHATKSRIRKTVDEDFYDTPISPESLIKAAENHDVDYLNEIIKKHSSEWPTTYTFTKAVAEEAVRKMAGDLPVCIVRPSIVISAYREPCPGWVDTNNVFGATGLVLGTMTGAIHTLMADLANHMDFIPVDIVSNALIVAGWETARNFQTSSRRVKIYTVSNTRNPMTYGMWAEGLVGLLTNELNTTGRELISPRTIWYGFAIVTRSQFIYLMLHWFLHCVPAFFVDCVLYVLGKKPMCLKLYKRVANLSKSLGYYSNLNWIFEDSNTKDLYDSLSPTDKELFNFDMTRVHPRKLMTVWVLGVRRYIIKDGLKDTLYGRKKQFWLKILHYITLAVYFYALFKLFCLLMSFVTLIF